MANHFVELHCQEQAKLLLEYLNKAFPAGEVPFWISARQNPPEAREESTEGEDQTIHITISGVGDNTHTLHSEANPIHLRAQPGEHNVTFIAARVGIEQAVEAWWDREAEKRNVESSSPR